MEYKPRHVLCDIALSPQPRRAPRTQSCTEKTSWSSNKWKAVTMVRISWSPWYCTRSDTMWCTPSCIGSSTPPNTPRRRDHSRVWAHSVLITCSVEVSQWGSVTSSNSIWHSGFLVFSSQWSLTLAKKLALVLTTRKVNNRHFMIEDNNGSAEWANLNIFTFSAWLVVKYC